jgi:cell wall-associated NlpC family hydrolase
MTDKQREAVVAEAESWLRTPYHTNAAVKGAGADCALMPLAVYTAALGLAAPPLPKYTQQWHLHRDEERYLQYVRDFGGVEIAEAHVKPGDFALWRVGRVYSHGAIIVCWPRILHAINPRGVVWGDATQEPMLNRTGLTRPLFFTF